MYIPEAFCIEDNSIIQTFLEEHPFGVLLVNGADGFPVAAHIPFLWSFESDEIIVEGHLSNRNPLAEKLTDGRSAKIIVEGEHGYVSSSVYGHVNVPTYNYQAAHLYGVMEVLSSEKLIEHLEKVVNTFEKNRKQPLQFNTFPEPMMQEYLREITGFRLTVFKTEVAFKLSQNRSRSDFESIVRDLENGTDAQRRLAKEMKRWVSGV